MSGQNEEERFPSDPTTSCDEPNKDRGGETRLFGKDGDSGFSVGTHANGPTQTEGSPDSYIELPEDYVAPERERIGRYRVETTLGQGGFGTVYLATDEELQRKVTIKIPHAHRIANSKRVNAFLNEARTLAMLEHPNVVPVHDVGHTEDGVCFIVSRYIDGKDLFHRHRESPLQVTQAVELIATIAEALHYVHSMGVIHRDIKPSNILLDKRGTAYLADFGLALLEEDAARTSRIAGTPSYMSPEQARGENHLVTGRSDIFSLGIVLYELITGRRPFPGSNSFSVLRMIQENEVQPPSELNPEVSPELERICLKALSKRSSARHATGINLANDLRYLLTNPNHVVSAPALAGDETADQQRRQPAESENSHTQRRAKGLVPRGLRSFGVQDAHFFNDLLPGPYDRDGVPESILFWKRRIEERDPENTFRVGLIYGPSGCGKSSFCKAGLIPTLPSDVITVFVEAAPEATESRLLNRIRRKCPYLNTSLGLRESIAALRHQTVMGEGTKVLLVVDQFEQWLYSTAKPEHSELAKALRQCDGEHIQCILLVRDDFWLVFSRFMEHVEIDLLQNHNMSMIDLFDMDHAKLVLREFGRAFGRLPRNPTDLSRDERAFIEQAIAGLSEDGKVIPVRIALFAEMIKTRPWSTATLKQIGGTKGVGVLFLEENFSSPNAPAEHAVHLEAVYQTLGALLPKPGTDLKGHMRSREDLLSISGYVDQPKQFQSLIRTLDSDLHLITRTTYSGRGDASASNSGSFSNLQSSELLQGEFYQLAHDYLVPAIREWQVRTQRGTRRGRAEIRLAQRAEVWGTRPESRHLPTMTEWISMHAFTAKRRWNETERKMMGSAGRRHGRSLAVFAILFALGLFGFQQFRHWNQADSLTQQLEVAKPNELSGLFDALESHGNWSIDQLRSLQQENDPGTTKHLYSTLALLRFGSDKQTLQIKQLLPAILNSDPETLAVLCKELMLYRDELIGNLWEQAADESLKRANNQSGRPYHPRLNAVMALANFDPPSFDDAENSNWRNHAEFATEELIHFANVDRANFHHMVELVRPAANMLVSPLAEVMVHDESNQSRLRKSASQDLLVRLLERRMPEYVNLLLGADVEQILASIDLIDKNFANVRSVLESAVTRPIQLEEEGWHEFALRKANAAGLLLRHNVTTPEVWAALVPDIADTSSNQILEVQIHSELQRLLPSKHWKPLLEQGDRNAIRQRYEEITFGRNTIPNSRTHLIQRVRPFEAKPESIARKLLVEQTLELQCGLIQALGEFDPTMIDASLREQIVTLAQGWVLSAEPACLRSNAFWLLVQWNSKDWATDRFESDSPLRTDASNWYVNSVGQMMIQLPQHQKTDTYRIEVAAAETTLAQLKSWQSDGVEKYNWSGEDNRAAGNVSYHECVAFCNWLSRKEGLGEDQLCYPDRTDSNDPPAQLLEDYKSRSGYRLPMADEWFYACSGGAITDYSFGSGREGPGPLVHRLFDGYVPAPPGGTTASWMLGSARPNGFGIFDMYSNVREWANDIDPQDSTRIQLCGYDFRSHLGMRGVEPRFLGWSEPNSSRSFYGFRLFRSRPMTQNTTD